MSEINKPENDSTDLKCPFNPNQYNIGDDNITVPAGTSAWALSLVYLGKQVHRSGWNAPIEHMRLAHKSEVGSTDDGAAYIEKSDKDGYWSRWVPTQEDLMACDWNLLKLGPKPDNCMLGFDLELGAGRYNGADGGYQTWGYLADEELASEGVHAFGALTNFQNRTDITKFSLFVWDKVFGQIIVRVSSQDNRAGYQKMVELFSKELTLTVDDVPYYLGNNVENTINGQDENEYAGSYQNNDAQKLGALLKQNVGNTLHFCFNWK